MQAELATTADVPSWLELVREVEPLFGSMPDFEVILVRKIDPRALMWREKAAILQEVVVKLNNRSGNRRRIASREPDNRCP